jgi:drug/metabolite transporter (DMT)-like permease
MLWWPFRALQSQGLHPLWATAIIYVIGLVGLLALLPQAWRGLFRHPLLWLLVLAAGMTNVGFNWSVTVGDVVRAVLLFYLMPAWVVLLAWPLLGERPNAASLLRLVLALGGVVLVLKTPGSPWPLPESLADWLALMGGFCFALTNVLLRKLNHTPEGARMLAMFIGGAVMSSAVATLGLQLGVVPAATLTGTAWLGLALALSLALLAGNLALQFGAARLSASSTSIIMLSEVVVASVSSVLLGTGSLSAQTLAGGALILLASLLAVLPVKGKQESAL